LSKNELNVSEDRKKAIKEMESTEIKTNSLLFDIFDQNPISMWISDDKGIFIWQNQACRAIWGAADETLIGKFNIFDDPIFKEENNLLLVKKVFDQGETVKLTINYEPKIYKKLTGIERSTRSVMEVTIAPIKDKNGKTKNAIIYQNDVTQRVIAEEELKDVKQKYFSFIQHSGEGTSIIEFNEKISINTPITEQIKAIYKYGYIAMSNDKLAQMYGFSRGDELVGKRILEFHGSDINPKNIEFLRAWIKSDYKILNAESEEIDKNGNKLYFSNNNIGIIEKDFLVRIWGSQLDITEHKKAQKALIDSEARFRGIFESKMVGNIFWNAEGDITEANEAFLEMVGYTKDEILSKRVRWKDMTPPEYLKIDEILLKELATKGFISPIEKEYYHKDGHRIPIVLGAATLADDDKSGVAFILDNTEIKKKEEYLRLLSKAVEQSTDGIATTDLDGNLIFINDAWCKMHGYSDSKNLLGKNLSIFYNNDQMKNTVRNFMIEVKKLGAFSGEVGHITKDGRIFPTFMSTTLLRNEKDKPYGMLSIARDITESKKAEEKLKDTVENLKRSNEELEQFAYIASHDLQEPLRSVASFTQLLQKRYKDKLDKDANEFIQFAVDGATKMQNLIKDLLMFSRVGTRGKLFSEIDMNLILTDVLDSLLQSIKETEAEITYDHLPTIVADDSQMKQLLQNLIANAIKFNGDDAPRIHITGKNKANEWVFSVKDNGIGIDSDYFDKIFIIFQRLHKAAEYRGTGIGLAVCKKIAQRHGGKIWVTSKPGKGSTFHFTIRKNK